MPDKIVERILDAPMMKRTLDRMATAIVEENRGSSKLALIGIRTRGAPLAERLAKRISKLSDGVDVPVGILDITLYRDDIAMSGKAPHIRATDIPFELKGRNIVLVDDVLYTGRTTRAAIEATLDNGRPDRIQLAVLIDRTEEREMPIQGDFVGRAVHIAPGHTIRVRVNESDKIDEVVLVEKE